MGNNSSSSPQGGIHVQLEKLDYFPGEFMNGSVYISLYEPLEAATQWIGFKGMEHTRWTTGSGKNRRTHSQRVINVNYQSVLVEWAEGLQQGSYVIPFSFKLPVGIPGSFHYQNGKIQYSLEFKLVNKKRKICFAQTNVLVKQSFQPSEFLVNVSNNINAGMSTWCCIKKGNCMIKAQIPKNAYNVQEQIPVYMEIDNSHGKLAATYTEVALYRQINLRAHSSTTQRRLRVGVVQSHGLEAASELATINTLLNLWQFSQNFNDMYTCRGQIVQCSYFLVVRANMDGSCMCCNMIPNVVIPIIMIAPTTLPPPLPPPPANWNPQNMHAIQMEYNQAQNYPNAADDPFFNKEES